MVEEEALEDGECRRSFANTLCRKRPAKDKPDGLMTRYHLHLLGKPASTIRTAIWTSHISSIEAGSVSEMTSQAGDSNHTYLLEAV